MYTYKVDKDALHDKLNQVGLILLVWDLYLSSVVYKKVFCQATKICGDFYESFWVFKIKCEKDGSLQLYKSFSKNSITECVFN